MAWYAVSDYPKVRLPESVPGWLRTYLKVSLMFSPTFFTPAEP